MGDHRDGITWVALELSRQGEQKVEDGTLEQDLRSSLGIDASWPVFIPAKVYSKNGKRVTVHLMEGYAFVASGLDEITYFRLEQDKKVVSKVITGISPAGVRVLNTISDRQVQELKAQLAERIASDITSGMYVRIVDGKYRGLEGEVLYVEEDYAIVHIAMRSLQAMARIPRVFLDAGLDATDDDEGGNDEMGRLSDC